MILTIGGFIHTDALEEGSLVIRHYGALRSSFKATLNFSKIPLHFPKVGQEILIVENETILWGGILVELEEVCHSTRSFTLTLRGQGYEQILQRYCLPSLELGENTPSDTAKYIFQTYLNPADSLTLGTVDTGLTKKYAYTFYPAKASSVFDRLAGENGFVWWVDKTKTFHMQANLPQAQQSLSLDLTGKAENRLEDLQTLVYRASTADYKNLQYVYNRATNISGYEFDVEGLQDMCGRYGSGEYGASAANSVITDQTDAQTVARQMLARSPGMGEIEFATDSDAFVLGQTVGVTAPVCGLESETLFCVTEIRAVYFYNRFRYTVTARQTDYAALASSWEEVLAGGKTN